jgi:antitoxin StbD
MTMTGHREILPTTEARAKLSQILAEFERDGINAEPVTFGSHRRPQGVLIGWDLWLEILPAIEDLLDATEARHRLDRAGDKQVSFDDAAATLGRDPHRYR